MARGGTFMLYAISDPLVVTSAKTGRAQREEAGEGEEKERNVSPNSEEKGLEAGES